MSTLAMTDLRGGRNGFDPPGLVAGRQCIEAVNVEFFNAALGQKRAGTAAIDLTGLTTRAPVSKLWVYQTPTAEELWGANAGNAAPPTNAIFRHSGAAITMPSQPACSQATNACATTFNGKLFITGNAAVGAPRYTLAVWDGTSLRGAGLSTPIAPIVADTGAGAYAAVLRYYRTVAQHKSGSTVIRQSEMGPSQAFTPSGAGTAARVNHGGVFLEGETHWQIYVSADDATYYLLTTLAVATTDYDDNSVVGSWTGAEPATAGDYTPPGPWKYITTDGNRLLGAGSWTAADKQSRVWFTPRLGATDVADDERIPLDHYVDVNESDGDKITGLSRGINGVVYVFKARHTYRLMPTGVDTEPYKVVQVSAAVGAVSHAAIVMAEDETGAPAVYFLSYRGPYRLSAAGLLYVGTDIEDLWATRTADAEGKAHGIYYVDRHQIWWWIPTATSATCNLKLVLDTRYSSGGRGGWVQHTGASAAATCSVMLSRTYPTVTNSDAKKPAIGVYHATENRIWNCDTGVNDAGTTYQGYVTTAPVRQEPKFVNVDRLSLAAKAQAATSIQVSAVRDFGKETRSVSVSLAADGTETRIDRQVDLGMGQAHAIQFTLGDSAASAATWTLDALYGVVTTQDPY